MNTNTQSKTTIFSQDSKNTKKTNDAILVQQSGHPSFGQEKEVGKVLTAETVQAVAAEVELPKEVEQAGVTILRDTIELPPDVKRLGVTHAGQTTPSSVTALPAVVLPISDPQVVAGLHQHVSNALRWLAEWCIMRLKKAHVALKIIHGKIIRVKS